MMNEHDDDNQQLTVHAILEATQEFQRLAAEIFRVAEELPESTSDEAFEKTLDELAEELNRLSIEIFRRCGQLPPSPEQVV